MPDQDAHDISRPNPLRRTRFALEYAFVALAAACLRRFPRAAAMALGSLLGKLAWLMLRRDRAVALANLDLVLGAARTAAQKRRIARRTFERLGRIVLGLFWSPRLTPAAALHLCDCAQLFAILSTLRERRTGVVLVTAHYGDWEQLCLASGFGGFPVTMVTEPLANRRLERLFDRLRTASGNRTIEPKFAMLKLFRALRRGERVALMCDVNGRRGRGGVWVDFFGRPVFNGAALAELALRSRSAVLFVAAMPLPDGRHQAICWPVIEPASTGDRDADARRLTQQFVDCHAELLRTRPEPWLWTYKRWKRKPAADAPGYPPYASFKRVD